MFKHPPPFRFEAAISQSRPAARSPSPRSAPISNVPPQAPQLAPGLIDYALLFCLAAAWGASFMLIKVAVVDLPPISLTALRLLVAVLAVGTAAWLSGQRLPMEPRLWRFGALAALTGNALPFTLISWGEETIDSGLAAILMAAMPLMTLILAHWLTQDEKFTTRKLAGVLFGLVGIVVLIGPAKLTLLGDETVRQLAVVGAAMCYGLNAVITKRLVGYPPFAMATTIFLAAAVMLVPVALVVDQPWTLPAPSSLSIAAAITLGLVQTGLATLVMFTIVRRQGASFFSQINLLVPLFGVVWGALVLAERPGPNALLALGLILTGVAVARRRRS